MRPIALALLVAACGGGAPTAPTTSTQEPAPRDAAIAQEPDALEPGSEEPQEAGTAHDAADAARELGAETSPASLEASPEPAPEADPPCVPSTAACATRCGGSAPDGCGGLVECAPNVEGCCTPSQEESPACKGSIALYCKGFAPPTCKLVNGSLSSGYFCCPPIPPAIPACNPKANVCATACGNGAADGCGGLLACPATRATCCTSTTNFPACTDTAELCDLRTGYKPPASCVTLATFGPSGSAAYCCATP